MAILGCALPIPALWLSPAGAGGSPPPARAGHSATALPDGRMVVFGGMDEKGAFKNDLFVVDVPQMSWIKLTGIAKGAPPKPRAYHS